MTPMEAANKARRPEVLHAMELQGEDAARLAAKYRRAHQIEPWMVEPHAMVRAAVVFPHSLAVGSGENDAERRDGVAPGRITERG